MYLGDFAEDATVPGGQETAEVLAVVSASGVVVLVCR